METSTPSRRLAAASFDRFIDYAGLFPPAQLSMDAAVAEYDAARSGRHASVLGRFIVPAARLRELETAVRERTFPLAVICDRAALTEPSALSSASGTIGALEIALSSDAPAGLEAAVTACAREARAAVASVPIYVELPSGLAHDRRRALLDAIGEHGMHAKLRCGGVVREAFPSVSDVAGFIYACAEADVAFKATAGLHHPFRHVDAATGFAMHGFVNLLAAAALATRLDAAEIERIVACEDPDAFAIGDEGLSVFEHRIDAEQMQMTRERRFVSYGSCSFAEPIDDLIALGWMHA